MSRKSAIGPWLGLLLLLAGLLGAAGSANAGGQASISYQYDDAGRLKVVTYGDGTSTTYTLDAAGNRQQVAIIPLSPGAPGKPAISGITQHTATVTWTAPTAGGAVVSYQYSIGGAYTNVGNALSVSLTGLTSGTPYTVTIQAINTGGNASAANNFNTLVDTGAPGQPQFSNITATTVTATWSAPAQGSIASYEYSVNNSGLWTNVGLSTSTSITGLTPGANNTVQVRARDTGNNPGPVSTNIVLTLTNAPGTPTFSSITASTATVTWGGVSGSVSSYEYSLNNGASWTNVGTATSVNLSGLGSATVYTVSVHAVDASGPSVATSASFITVPGAPGPITFTSLTTTSVTVNWGAASGSIDHYEYSVAGIVGFTSVGSALSINLTGLSAATVYTVQVRAVDASGGGGSISNTVTTFPGSMGPLAVTSITATSATVGWSALSGAALTGYEYSLNSGSWTSVGNAVSVSLTGLAFGTAYSVQVHGVDASGAGAASSTSFSTSAIPNAPTGLRATNPSVTGSSGRFTVLWSGSTGATSYQLFDSTNSPATQVYSGSTTQFTLTRPTGFIYAFYVEACGPGGCSPPSSTLHVTVDCSPSCL